MWIEYHPIYKCTSVVLNYVCSFMFGPVCFKFLIYAMEEISIVFYYYAYCAIISIVCVIFLIPTYIIAVICKLIFRSVKLCAVENIGIA